MSYTGSMKLIGRYDSPFVRRVGVSLHVLGLSFDHLPLSPFSQADEFRTHASIGRMPALILDDGETLIESGAILDYLDEVVGPASALIPSHGTQRRKALKLLGCATAACDKAVAINYERRRPANLIYDDWIKRCRSQLVAALVELESTRLQLVQDQPLRQIEITTGCAIGYIKRVEPDAFDVARYPSLERLTLACEARAAFSVCPQ
jgi:glutathione S-transferase